MPQCTPSKTKQNNKKRSDYQELEGRGNGKYCLMGIEFQLRCKKKLSDGLLHSNVNVLNSLNYTLKSVYNGKCYMLYSLS
jgi:hypothetical protein